MADGTTTTPMAGVNPMTQTETQQGIATYAQPYVSSLLGSTMGQLFQTDASGNVTGLRGYTPYSYNPADYYAGFTPLQQQAQAGIAGLQAPWQTQTASGSLADAISRAQNLQYQPTSTAYQSIQAPSLTQYQMQQPQNVQAQQVGTPTMQAAQTGYNPYIQTFQMGPAQQVGTQSFLAPGTATDYMSPYMQNVVDVQQQQAKRQAAIAGQAQQAQAAQSGAFGGARDVVQRQQAAGELQRNLANIQAQGLQQAYGQGMQQFNTQQQAALQAALANQAAGLTTGQQNLAAAQAAQQLGVQTGLQTSLANLTNQQQAAVQNQAAQLQAQGMNAQQALQAALANQQAGLTTGQQNLSALLGIQSLGAGQSLQAQQLNQAAQQQANQLAAQQQQFGANLGLQGLQAAMSGAGQLGGLGSQALQNQLSVLGAQQQAGLTQQQLQQNIINQAVQNYQTAQQYPYMQLGFMQNMLQGLPIQTTSQQGYQAAPSMVSQLAGLGLAGAGLGGLFGGSGTGTANTSFLSGLLKNLGLTGAKGGKVKDSSGIVGIGLQKAMQ